MPNTSPPVAAVFNTSPDTVELLRTALSLAGFVVISGYTHEIREATFDMEGFIRRHRPDVIVYDIAPPYSENCQLFRHFRSIRAFGERPVVVTSTNSAQAQKLLGRDHQVYEIVGKPFDLDQIVQAVKEASRSRPTRAYSA